MYAVKLLRLLSMLAMLPTLATTAFPSLAFTLQFLVVVGQTESEEHEWAQRRDKEILEDADPQIYFRYIDDLQKGMSNVIKTNEPL